MTPPGGCDYDVIYLAPRCPQALCEHQELRDAGDGRLWCQDDVWGACRSCGVRPTRYVRDKRTGRRK